MKRFFGVIFFFVLLIGCSYAQFIPTREIAFTMQKGINIDFLSEKLTKEYDEEENYGEEDNVYVNHRRYALGYEKKEIAFYVFLIVNKKNNSVLNKLVKGGILKYESVGTADGINKSLVGIYPGKKYNLSNGVEYTKYIYPVGNGWTTDLLGYAIPLQSVYAQINIVMNNIVSTYVQKDAFISQWTQNEVDAYKDRKNKGILFYGYMDEMIASCEMTKGKAGLGGVITASGVRVRKSPDLSAEMVTQLDKDASVEVIDCTETKTKIGTDEYPWISIRTNDGKIGWLYGKYIKIVFP